MQKDMPWTPAQLLASAAFRPLHPAIQPLPATRFPTLQDCNALLAQGDETICVHDGTPLRLVAQAEGKLPFEAQYEPRCYLRGEVQTRSDNWHDLLNALVWYAFPRTKAAINVRHYQALTAARAPGSSQRGAVRDMATLFDESGVVVPYADERLAESLCDFRWRELFWQRRADIAQGMDFLVFGHGLYEKLLAPYVGLTGQGLLLKVEAGYFALPWAQRQRLLDERLAAYIADPTHCLSTRELTPVPLLGIPGWWPANEEATFYDDTRYFRPGRQARAARTPLSTAPSSVAG